MRVSSEKPSAQRPQAQFEDKASNDGLDTPTDDDKKLALDQVDGEGPAEDGEEATPAIIIPLKYRITAIILIILFGTGNTYAGFILGPLKTRLVRELKISSELQGQSRSITDL